MTREHDRDVVPEPSALPANPSVSELVAEIDRTRHEAARTVAALTDKLAATRPPTSMAGAMGMVAARVRRVPRPVWLVTAAVVLGWWLRHRSR